MASPREPTEPSRIAAVLFDRDDEVDAAVGEFVAAVRREGALVAGFLQERLETADCAHDDVRLRDLVRGDAFAIMQDLGAGATGCRLDAAAIAFAAGRLGEVLALEPEPDLVIVNRFGKLECEGGGLLAELGETVARGLPVVVCVPLRFRDAWVAFAGGLDVELPPVSGALADWWARARLAPAIS
jgi:hypothetical protein